MNGLLASSMLLALSRVTGVAMQAAMILWLAGTLSIVDMGYFGLIYAGLGVGRYIGPLGTDLVVLRQVAAAGGTGSPEAHMASAASLAITLGTSLIGSLVCAILLANFSMGLTAWEVGAVAVALPAFALMGSFAGQIRGFGWNLAAQVPEAIGIHLLFGTLLILLGLAGDLERQSILVCLAMTGWGIAGCYLLIRMRLGFVGPLVPSRTVVASQVRAGLVVFQALAVTALSTRAPLFLASALIGPAAAAVMEIASRFGRVPEITTNSVGVTFSPVFARAAEQPDRTALRRILFTSCGIAAAPALAWLLLVLMVGEAALALLLPEAYGAAYEPLLLITTAVAINAALGMASTLLLMSNRERVVATMSLIQLAVVVAAAVILTHSLGLVGLAWSVVIGALVRDGGIMLIAVRASTRYSRPQHAT